MTTCSHCGVEQTPSSYCVVEGDFHVTFGTVYLQPVVTD